MKTIQWGMIGCGDVTLKKSAPSFNKVAGSSLVGVAGRNLDKTTAYAMTHGIPKVYDGAEDMIADPSINAIYVSTPPSSHAHYAIMAMRGGKAVYVEKPMALSYQECIEMNRVSAETGMPLFVAYYRRSMDYFIRVRDLLSSGVIGKVILIQSSLFQPPRQEDLDSGNLPWRVIPEVSGGGYFHDMACHELDLLMYLFGEVEAVSGFAINTAGLYEPEDTVVASMKFTGGPVYSGSWSFVSGENNSADIIEVLGEKGKIVFSCFSFSPIKLVLTGGSEEFPVQPPDIVQYPMIKQVVEELQGISASPSTGDSAARASWVMDKILGRI